MILKSGLISIPKRILLVLAILPWKSKDCSTYKRLGAELIGTFGLVFLGLVGLDISNTIGNNELGKFAVGACSGVDNNGYDIWIGQDFRGILQSCNIYWFYNLKASQIKGFTVVYIGANIWFNNCKRNSPARHRTVW